MCKVGEHKQRKQSWKKPMKIKYIDDYLPIDLIDCLLPGGKIYDNLTLGKSRFGGNFIVSEFLQLVIITKHS